MPAKFVRITVLGEEDEAAFRVMLKPIADRSRGRITLDTIMGDIEYGVIQAWAVMEDEDMVSVVCTRVIDYDSGKRVFRVDYAAGRIQDATEFMPQLLELARGVQAHTIRIEGREGWKKIFPDWQHVSTIIEKEIDYG